MNLHDDKQRKCLLDIVKQANIRTVIETGCFKGDTCCWMSELMRTLYGPDQQVITVEIREDFLRDCKARLEAAGVAWVNASSDEFLEKELLSINIQTEREWKGNVFLMLDAHWQDNWPLKRELQAILKSCHTESGFPACVLIDDFEVPNRPNFSWCRGGGGAIGDPICGPRTTIDDTPCNYETFKAELDEFGYLYYPDYLDVSIGHCIASDHKLDLGPDFICFGGRMASLAVQRQ